MGKIKSETKTERSFVDNLIGTKHSVTKISDGTNRVEARGDTPKQSEERASKKWVNKKKYMRPI
jgi:hypothetical protein